jgi:hypothetical protein
VTIATQPLDKATSTAATLIAITRMSRREKRPTKKDRRAEATARLEKLPKLSETMLKFAQPLLDMLPNPPPIEDLRQLMVLVTVAWNLPLYEQRKHPQAAAFRATFDQAQAHFPPEIAKILTAMLYCVLSGTLRNRPVFGCDHPARARGCHPPAAAGVTGSPSYAAAACRGSRRASVRS